MDPGLFHRYNIFDSFPISGVPNSVSLAEDPFSLAQEPFSLAQEPFYLAQDPFSLAQDPFSLALDPVGELRFCLGEGACHNSALWTLHRFSEAWTQ